MAKKLLKIIHISDPHIMADPMKQLQGVKTTDTLRRVVKAIQEESADLILCTGDISEDGSIESYERFKSLIQPLKMPLKLLHGNHDHFQNLSTVLKSHYVDNMMPFPDINCTFVYMDTVVPGEIHGWVSDAELTRVSKLCENLTSQKIYLLSHHPLVKTGTGLIDQYMTQNSAEVLQKLSMIDYHLFGHVHHQYDLHVGQTRFIAAPSTAMQFKKHLDHLEVEHQVGYNTYVMSENYFEMKTTWIDE